MDLAKLDEPFRVVQYDPGWPVLFEQERDRLAPVLASLATAVEHVGSTAVPGMAAKPVVDLLVGAAPGALPEARTVLVSAGYEDVVLYLRSRSHNDFNVTLTEHQSAEWEREILFRDYLRAHVEDARAYEQLKLGAAARHGTHLAYAGEKRALIEKLLECAQRWRAEAAKVDGA